MGCGTTRTVTTNLPPSNNYSINPIIQLHNDINSILADSLFIPSFVSIKIISLDNEEVLYEQNSKSLMHPASNIKLFTSAAALSALDTNYKFKTAVYIDENTLDGNVTGNIYLKGFGNPDLATSDLDSLALAVRHFGVKEISRNIIVDNLYFDENYWGTGWMWDDESAPDAPYISALSVNKNCIGINIFSDSLKVNVSTNAPIGFVSIINNARVVYDSIYIPLKIKQLSSSNTNTFLIEGDIFKNTQVTRNIALRNPDILTGAIFKEALKHAGILVSGDVVRGTLTTTAREIAQHKQSLEKIIVSMNKVSDNLSAENTLKVLGAVKRAVPGSAEDGVSIVKQFLSYLNIDTTKISVVDGSGVSRYKQPKIFSIFYNSLPIAGVDGTLSKRMVTYPTAGNLRAKTGTLNGVSCLSGYVQTRDGEMLAFSIMMQNFLTPIAEYRMIQDRICNLLAGFSRNTWQR